MNSNLTRRAFFATTASMVALVGTACMGASKPNADTVLQAMSVEQKIAQMIVPAFRTWGGAEHSVTDLSAAPDLAEALRRHQYGGVVLYDQNISGTEQAVRFIRDLQSNNAKGKDAQATMVIPYFVSANQEGGTRAPLSMGTRGTGNMAIGATGKAGRDNALQTGSIFGQELAALGINVNLAPCVDVIVGLADESVGTRAFSDDATVVAQLGASFAEGVGESNVVSCLKHFPGVGNGGGRPVAVQQTLDELHRCGLIPFKSAVESGAEMVMVSAATFPAIDDEHELADDNAKGFYPAAMSQKIVGKLLRKELKYDGVVMTAALETDQFLEEPETGKRFFSGEKGSVECAILVAQECIEAGCDILLVPKDLASKDAATWYDSYISGIVELVKSGSIDEKRIDESVERILALKRKRGIMDLDVTEPNVDDAVAAASGVVGSADHHDAERYIAKQAITLLKNDGAVPVPLHDARIVILGRSKEDANPIASALTELVRVGTLDTSVYIEDRLTGKTNGAQDSKDRITVDCYYDSEGEGALTFSDELSASIADAQYVICLSSAQPGTESWQDDDACAQGVIRALQEAHEASAKFVLLSDNIPIDAARYTESDAIVCCYLAAGLNVDPVQGSDETQPAINANIPAALYAIFGEADMPGMLPVNVHELDQGPDGLWSYTDKLLYARGQGV